jgi:hypothetical protein
VNEWSDGTDRGGQPPSGGQRGDGQRGSGQDGSPTSWERRVSELTGDFQRWLIKTSARNVRDDLGDQVKRAIRGSRAGNEDVWATATTEPPDALDQAPECAWCPICRAARRMAQAQAQAAAQASASSAAKPASGRSAGGGAGHRGERGSGVPAWYGAAGALAGAARDALSGLDAILSYRPPDAGSKDSDHAEAGEADVSEKRRHEPGHRG